MPPANGPWADRHWSGDPLAGPGDCTPSNAMEIMVARFHGQERPKPKPPVITDHVDPALLGEDSDDA